MVSSASPACKAFELLVQVHHQPVQLSLPEARRGAHGGQRRFVQHVAGGLRHGGQRRLQAGGKRGDPGVEHGAAIVLRSCTIAPEQVFRRRACGTRGHAVAPRR